MRQRSKLMECESGKEKMRIKLWLRNAIGKNLSKRGYSLVRNTVSGTGWEAVLRMSLPTDLRDASLVLDVGANWGEISKLVLKASPGAEMYAFEPIPQLADALRELTKSH